MEIRRLGEFIAHRKEFITINDGIEYKRCRVQVNRRGVVLRDVVKGLEINTKRQQICKKGDFLVAEIDAKVGGYGFVPEDLVGAIVSSHYYLFEVNESLLLRDYLKVLIRTDIVQNQINSKGSTNYAAIRAGDVLNFEIPYVKIKEQKKIVASYFLFEGKHNLITEELSAQTNFILKLRQSVLQEAMQGKLIKQNSKGDSARTALEKIRKENTGKEKKTKKDKKNLPVEADETPFEIPRGWVWCRLGEIIEIIGGSQPPKGKFIYEEKQGYVRLVQIRDFKSDKFKTYIPKESATRPFEKDDIMIGRYGPPVFQILRGLSGTYNVALMKAIPNPMAMIKDFCYYLLQEKRIQKIIIDDSERTAGQSGVRKPLLESIVIALPSLSEQKIIVSKVERLLKICDELEVEITNSKKETGKLMQSVLREVFIND
ncbi:MAG: restriction endonuclease subunit S [Bacteroidota bacterium]